MEARFERNYLQDSTGWHERAFSLEDQRHLRRISHLHGLTLSWIETHPDWRGGSERFLSQLRLPSRLRLPADQALALLNSHSSDSLASRLIDEKPTSDCLLRLHQLAWRVHTLALQKLKPEEESSRRNGQNAASAHFMRLGINSDQRLKWNAADHAHSLASPELWLGSHPEQAQGAHPFFLFRRITSLAFSFEILALPMSPEEEELRGHHLNWLAGWVQSASEGKYHLQVATRRTTRNSALLEVLPT